MIENDEIMEEWDIFINTELTPFIHLVPLPSSSVSTRFNSLSSSSSSATETLQARFKPNAKRLELVLPLTDLTGNNLILERVKEFQMEKGQKLVGAGWQWRRVQYLLGQFTTDGELHMTPVESVIPLNTCLSHLDDYDARMKLPYSSSTTSSGTTSRRSNSHEDMPTVSKDSTPNSNVGGTAAKAIQVQFRKKETEEQVQARLNSFAYLQRQVDDEPWITLKHFHPKAQEVVAVRDKLIGTCRDPLEFLPNEDYLDKVINFNNEPLN